MHSGVSKLDLFRNRKAAENPQAFLDEEQFQKVSQKLFLAAQASGKTSLDVAKALRTALGHQSINAIPRSSFKTAIAYLDGYMNGLTMNMTSHRPTLDTDALFRTRLARISRFGWKLLAAAALVLLIMCAWFVSAWHAKTNRCDNQTPFRLPIHSSNLVRCSESIADTGLRAQINLSIRSSLPGELRRYY